MIIPKKWLLLSAVLVLIIGVLIWIFFIKSSANLSQILSPGTSSSTIAANLLPNYCKGTNGPVLAIAEGVCIVPNTPPTDSPFVTVSDMSKYSDVLTLASGAKTVAIGISNLAGGYGNYLSIKGFGVPGLEGRNLNNLGYGQGWQTTIRDRMHSLRYNPEPAAFTDYASMNKEAGLGAGAPVLIQNFENMGLFVQQTASPLYQGVGKGYDFTQYEDLVPDVTPKDGGNTDADFLAEVGKSQIDEVKSEMDFSSAYTNKTTEFGIPTMRYDYVYAYMRDPSAILQFSDPRQVDTTGKPVYDPNQRILDMSLATPGNQTAEATDLSAALPTYSLREYPTDFPYLLWTENGAWKNTASSGRGAARAQVASCSLQPDTPGYKNVGAISPYQQPENKNCLVDNDLLIMASSNDPAKGFAIAVYAPHNMPINKEQTWIVNKATMQVVSREDRRMQAFLNSTGGYTTVRNVIAGLRSPTSLAHAGLPGDFEMITQRVYVLFGTPQEIHDAVVKFQQSPAYMSESQD